AQIAVAYDPQIAARWNRATWSVRFDLALRLATVAAVYPSLLDSHWRLLKDLAAVSFVLGILDYRHYCSHCGFDCCVSFLWASILESVLSGTLLWQEHI